MEGVGLTGCDLLGLVVGCGVAVKVGVRGCDETSPLGLLAGVTLGKGAVEGGVVLAGRGSWVVVLLVRGKRDWILKELVPAMQIPALAQGEESQGSLDEISHLVPVHADGQSHSSTRRVETRLLPLESCCGSSVGLDGSRNRPSWSVVIPPGSAVVLISAVVVAMERAEGM